MSKSFKMFTIIVCCRESNCYLCCAMITSTSQKSHYYTIKLHSYYYQHCCCCCCCCCCCYLYDVSSHKLKTAWTFLTVNKDRSFNIARLRSIGQSVKHSIQHDYNTTSNDCISNYFRYLTKTDKQVKLLYNVLPLPSLPLTSGN